MKNRILIIFVFVLLFVSTQIQAQQGAITKQEYMRYIQETAEQGWNNLEEMRKRWRENIDLENVFGYRPPGNNVYLAALSANLYEITKENKYLDRTKSVLLYQGEFKKAYPEDFHKTRSEYKGGLPAIPNIFTFPKYVHAYAILRNHLSLTNNERQTIEQNIAESADFMINIQEWGPMNRAMLRAEGLLYAAKVLPDHPHQKQWKMYGTAILNDNWKNWEIEDTINYNGVWLYSLLGYASYVRNDEDFYHHPIMSYYFKFYLSLMCPAGIIPDYGDSRWESAWNRLIPFFEKGAAVNNDPTLRWAAAQYFRKKLEPLPERKQIFTALALSDAYRWADFDLPAEKPSWKSQEVLEDIVGKKIVFRDGWDKNDCYLLLNYRNVGDGGWLYREYLRRTIPVEEEKMHHGHSDENSIVLLMKNNTVLLHDGGYRDYMPSGPFGAFRSDYYHNRLVVRGGKIAYGQEKGEYRYSVRHAVPGQSMLEFFRNSGAHQRVRTQKIDFLTLPYYDMSRTRLIDDHLGYKADRLINYIKKLDWFVIFDIVRFTEPGYLTMANLWHTRKVLDQGPGWYDTTYDSLRNKYVGGDERLLIVFPRRKHLEEGTENIRRYWQNEKVIYQMIGRHGYLNDIQAFVTVLIPHNKEQDIQKLIQRIDMLDIDQFPKAVGITIKTPQKKYLIGAKLDLQEELIRDWRRPMYTYESGKIRYGDFETDAYNLFVVEDRNTIHYTINCAIKIKYKDRVLHEQGPTRYGLSFDATADKPGVAKLRYWEETINK